MFPYLQKQAGEHVHSSDMIGTAPESHSFLEKKCSIHINTGLDAPRVVQIGLHSDIHESHNITFIKSIYCNVFATENISKTISFQSCLLLGLTGSVLEFKIMI